MTLKKTINEKVTKCIECGGELFYKTNPPKRCEKCKNARAKKKGNNNRKRKKRNPDFSKEFAMFTILDEIFKGETYIRNGYYSFLISPKGQPMQLDIYYPDRKLALE